MHVFFRSDGSVTRCPVALADLTRYGLKIDRVSRVEKGSMSAIRIALNIGSIALVAVLGWLIVRIVLGVSSPSSLYAAEPIATPNMAVAAKVTARDYNFTSDPFSFGEAVIVPAEIVEDAPETTLNLKLKGIVSDSSAVFRLADGKDKPVAIGNEVMNGVTLMRTTKTFVILDVNGESQKLTLERVKIDANSDKQVIGRAAPKSPAVPSRADAERLFTQIELLPYQEEGSARRLGYKIKPRAGANLTQFGLRSGDVVTRIGPVQLNANRVNLQELRELISSGAAQDIDILRDGSAVTIRLGQ